MCKKRKRKARYCEIDNNNKKSRTALGGCLYKSAVSDFKLVDYVLSRLVEANFVIILTVLIVCFVTLHILQQKSKSKRVNTQSVQHILFSDPIILFTAPMILNNR